jgi:hypothetical protein
MQICVDFMDKYPDLQGSALAPNMDCADGKQGGRIRALPGSVYVGLSRRPAPAGQVLSNKRLAGYTKKQRAQMAGTWFRALDLFHLANEVPKKYFTATPHPPASSSGTTFKSIRSRKNISDGPSGRSSRR